MLDGHAQARALKSLNLEPGTIVESKDGYIYAAVERDAGKMADWCERLIKEVFDTGGLLGVKVYRPEG